MGMIHAANASPQLIGGTWHGLCDTPDELILRDLAVTVSKIRVSPLLLLLAALPAFSATTATPAAKAEIEKYAGPYPGAQLQTLKDLYRQHIEEAGFEKSIVERDLSYGPHERNKLDVLRPGFEMPRAMPVIIFVHGGGFVMGNKSDGAIFDNILDYFTRHGLLGINATYRLAPEHQFPAAAEDLRDVVLWVKKNAAKYGGDPQKIFLMGHSAGAVHVANYTFMEELHPAHDGVLGSVLMSGVYDLGANADKEHAYYGAKTTKGRSQRTPLAQVDGRRIPLFVIDAEYDPLTMQQSAVNLMQAICQRDSKCPRHQQIAGHNHYSMTYHINSLDDSIASEILDFVIGLSGTD